MFIFFKKTLAIVLMGSMGFIVFGSGDARGQGQMTFTTEIDDGYINIVGYIDGVEAGSISGKTYPSEGQLNVGYIGINKDFRGQGLSKLFYQELLRAAGNTITNINSMHVGSNIEAYNVRGNVEDTPETKVLDKLGFKVSKVKTQGTNNIVDYVPKDACKTPNKSVTLGMFNLVPKRWNEMRIKWPNMASLLPRGKTLNAGGTAALPYIGFFAQQAGQFLSWLGAPEEAAWAIGGTGMMAGLMYEAYVMSGYSAVGFGTWLQAVGYQGAGYASAAVEYGTAASAAVNALGVAGKGALLAPAIVLTPTELGRGDDRPTRYYAQQNALRKQREEMRRRINDFIYDPKFIIAYRRIEKAMEEARNIQICGNPAVCY